MKFFLHKTRVLKTRDLRDIFTLAKRVFRTQVLIWIRVSKTQDVTFLKSFKPFLTYYFESLFTFVLHKTSCFQCRTTIVCWGKIRDLASPFGILIPSSVFLTVPTLVLSCYSPFSDRSWESLRECVPSVCENVRMNLVWAPHFLKSACWIMEMGTRTVTMLIFPDLICILLQSA